MAIDLVFTNSARQPAVKLYLGILKPKAVVAFLGEFQQSMLRFYPMGFLVRCHVFLLHKNMLAHQINKWIDNKLLTLHLE